MDTPRLEVTQDELAQALCETYVNWSVVCIMEKHGVAGPEEEREHKERHAKVARQLMERIEEIRL